MNSRSSFVRIKMRRGAAVLLVSLAALFPGGCTKAPRLTTQAAGHAITAVITGSPSIKTDADRAILSGQYGQVTVERTRARIEGLDWTRIPADVPVEVSILRGRLHVRAGSVRIERTVSHQ